ncbi:MAG: class I SAM-dependent methyltransferase [Chitinophagales bacterium]
MQYTKVVDKKRLQFIIQNLAANIPKRGKILDIGCGNGIISRALGEAGYEVLGIDLSEKAINLAKEYNFWPNVNFKQLAAEDLIADKQNLQQYDALICSEVLEHLQQPEILLQTAYELLKESGILLATVPNGYGPREVFVTKPMQWLYTKGGRLLDAVIFSKKMLGYKGTTIQSAAEHLEHIQFFTQTSIKQLATSNNFKLEKLNNADFVGDVFPFSLLIRRSEKLQNLDCQLANKLPNSFTSGFLMVWKK